MKQVRRVLTITLILNLLVATGKIMVGLMSGALSITADGFHSLMDGASNVVAIVASTIAGRPPDDDHPYGHGRYELLAALMIGGVLLLVAWEIVGGAVNRLASGTTPNLSPLAFAVMIGTLIVNIGVSTYQIRAGKRLKSTLLLADAANTRADVFITLSVLVSLVGIGITGWAWLDAVAALVVVGLIGRAAWRILASTGRVLVDTAPYSAQELTAPLHDLPCRPQIIRARSRGTRDQPHIDIDVCVPAAMTAEQTAHITTAIRGRLRSAFGAVKEVEVHFMPQAQRREDVALLVRAVADAHAVTTHEVALIDTETARVLELHVEVDPAQTLAQAHQTVTALENDLTDQLPTLDRVVTHIEPALNHARASGLSAARQDDLQRQALTLLEAQHPGADWHDLHVYAGPHGLTLTLHAALSPGWTLQRAHDLAEAAETGLRAAFPALRRVTIHTEPYDHGSSTSIESKPSDSNQAMTAGKPLPST
jgi:cation diffusion facilitator family transporter